MTTDILRPIIGIENRTAQEVFDIMCDRFSHRQAQSLPGDVGMRDMLAALRNASWLLADISPDGLVKKQIDEVIARAALTPSALSGDAGEGE